MSDKYLLPCACGQNVVVETRQAGTNVTCACGNSLEVPTIRGLAQLARAGQVEELLPPLWTIRQGRIFLGLMIAVPAFAFVAYHYSQIPRLREASIDEYVQRLSPAETWSLWRDYADGMPKIPSPHTKAVVKHIHSLQRWINVGLIVGVGGLIVSISGFLSGRTVARHRAKPERGI